MSRYRFRARDYIEHMLEAALKIQGYGIGKTGSEFLATPLLQDAIVRNFEILGEASRQLRDVLPDAEARFPVIPFRTMYATRNVLTHGYMVVNYPAIWEVVEKEVPPLIQARNSVLAAWPVDLSPPSQWP